VLSKIKRILQKYNMAVIIQWKLMYFLLPWCIIKMYTQKGMRLKDTSHLCLLIKRVFPKSPGPFYSFMKFPAHCADTKNPSYSLPPDLKVRYCTFSVSCIFLCSKDPKSVAFMMWLEWCLEFYKLLKLHQDVLLQ
jgi:hypothetical protein